MTKSEGRSQKADPRAAGVILRPSSLIPEAAASGGRPLPNSLPRPAGELEALKRAWALPRGWRYPAIVNNTHVGLW